MAVLTPPSGSSSWRSESTPTRRPLQSAIPPDVANLRPLRAAPLFTPAIASPSSHRRDHRVVVFSPRSHVRYSYDVGFSLRPRRDCLCRHSSLQPEVVLDSSAHSTEFTRRCWSHPVRPLSLLEPTAAVRRHRQRGRCCSESLESPGFVASVRSRRTVSLCELSHFSPFPLLLFFATFLSYIGGRVKIGEVCFMGC